MKICRALQPPAIPDVRVISQADEAEARSRLLRWRELKEAVENLDNEEKRVRAEVRHLLRRTKRMRTNSCSCRMRAMLHMPMAGVVPCTTRGEAPSGS